MGLLSGYLSPGAPQREWVKLLTVFQSVLLAASSGNRGLITTKRLVLNPVGLPLGTRRCLGQPHPVY